ncbi:MAG: bifunctional UDP-N-acetylglucosamine diphosphorylase/glucosamine-1-phosphate N-acetyltransferase GlmU [Myxococcales bacterium]|nr:bifunctional UDP-N-acetylglucosamine diphosphorylase/glucosamine-1-phosphate N-acetyltransferase GlmU [Myxococcota bacterium]MDW8281616.1 bifunctional UDP-N-acetylglucosamine diphosphorylase/glucosamine-1-phosphate N-acetyltransferase GlmU [Myxococcales bacterium]
MSLSTIILAAGRGTRMCSDTAKVLHRLCGRPLVEYPIRLAQALGSERIVLVVGHQAEAVRAAVHARFGPDAVQLALQAEQRGTGHAVLQALPLVADVSGKVLILYGDTPLLRADTLQPLIQAARGRLLALLSTRPPDPRGYGRLLRQGGRLVRVVEDRDCSEAERLIPEVNAGMYVIEAGFLREALTTLRSDNAQGELYLTDIVAQAAARDEVAVVEAPFEEVQGINDRLDLAHAEAAMRRRINEAHLRAGVTMRDPATTFIDEDVIIGRDTELGPGVILRGRCRIGVGCRIEAGCVLTDVTVGDQCHLKPYTVAQDSVIGPRVQLGPFAHLRPGSELAEDVHIGNFVELKKTRMGRGAKANHLTYLGDAEVGQRVNVGCGTITCNYDGYAKHRTIIEDGAFIGSDTQLVAPVRVGAGAVVGAGTTVVQDVPPGALALSRAPQINREGYAERRHKRREQARGDN